MAVAVAMQGLDNENAAMVTQQIAKAAAEELYQLSMAGPTEAYRIAAAQAVRDHRVALGTAGVNLASGGSQQDHVDAVSAADAGKKAAQQQASNDYGTDETAVSGVRRIAAADADLLFAQERGAADVDWIAATAGAYETYLIAEASAHATRVNQIAAAIADSATTETDTYATAMQSLATASPSPWATLEAGTAVAERDRVTAEASASVARAGQSSAYAYAAQKDFEIAQSAALVQLLIERAEAERDLGDAIAQAERDRTGEESQAASDLALTGNYAGELPAAIEVNTTRLEVCDASSEHYQKWVDDFTNGSQATPSFNTPLPEARFSGTELAGSKFRQGDPNESGSGWKPSWVDVLKLPTSVMDVWTLYPGPKRIVSPQESAATDVETMLSGWANLFDVVTGSEQGNASTVGINVFTALPAVSPATRPITHNFLATGVATFNTSVDAGYSVPGAIVTAYFKPLSDLAVTGLTDNAWQGSALVPQSVAGRWVLVEEEMSIVDRIEAGGGALIQYASLTVVAR